MSLRLEVPAKELAVLLSNAVTVGKEAQVKYQPMSDHLKESLWPMPPTPEEMDIKIHPRMAQKAAQVQEQRQVEYNNALMHRKLKMDRELPVIEAEHKAQTVQGCPHVLLAAVPGSGLVAYGFSRHCAGRTHMQVDGVTLDVSATLRIEDAASLASALNKIPGGKKAMATLTIWDEPESVSIGGQVGLVVMTVEAEGEFLFAGDDSDDGSCGKWFDMVDDLLNTSSASVTTPMVLTPDSLSRLSKVKTDAPGLDITATAHPNVNAVRMGRSFKGLIGAVDRDLYLQEEAQRYAKMIEDLSPVESNQGARTDQVVGAWR